MIDPANAFIAAAAAVLLGLFLTAFSINRSDNAAMNDMIKQGVDPIAAYCAVKGVTTSNGAVCKASIR